MKKNNNDVLKVKNDNIWTRIKKSLFHKELYNQRSITFKISASAIFLSMAVGLSLLEIFSVPTPWGATFSLRFFDNLLIIYSIAIFGLGIALLEGISLPWIHNLIDGHHTWLEMVFFIIYNVLVLFVTWFIYYILFNACHKITVPENVEDHDIHEYHYIKKTHEHHYKIINIKWRKKILAFIIIVPICALIETISFLIVAKILVNMNYAHLNVDHTTNIMNYSLNMLVPTDNITSNSIDWFNKITVAHIEYDYNHDNSGMTSIFESWQHILIFIEIFFGIFIAKYIINATLFLLLEQRTRQLVDRYGIYV